MLSKDYAVVFVGEDELPCDHDWALIRTGSDVVLVVKESRVTPCVLEEAWTAFRVWVDRDPGLAAAV